MSEIPPETPTEITADGDPHPQPPEPAPVVVRQSWGAAALALALALVVIGAVVAAAPWWAPLLPWGPQAGRDAALARRLDRVAAAEETTQHQLAASAGARHQIEGRVAVLERKPAAAPAELAQLQSQAGDLARRLATLEQAATQPPAVPPAVEQRLAAVESAQKDRATALAGLESRVAAIDGRLTNRAEAVAALGKRVAALESALRERAAAVSAVEKQMTALAGQLRERSAAAGADNALAFTVQRIADAVVAGRPFANEYQRLTALAQGRPELEEAAAPLAETAKTGVASRAALQRDLHALAARVDAAAAPAPSPNASWASQAWQGLRGLVRIRHAGTAEPGPEGSVAAAERALSAGDLKAAVGDVEKLPGGAATEWLREARRRLHTEAAVDRLETSLATMLGAPSPAPGPAAPGPAAPGPAGSASHGPPG
jgi:hypothetical protein